MTNRAAVAVLLVAVAASSVAEAQRPSADPRRPGQGYASDPAGMELDRIDGPTESGYSLLVSRSGDTVRSELHRDGAAVKAWLRTYAPDGVLSREAMEEGGALREEILYDEAGRPRLERFFVAGGDVEETAYEYLSGQLASKRTTRGDDELSAITYIYAPDGRLALAKESGGRAFGTEAARGGAFLSWRAGTDGMELRGYDRDGRLVEITTYDGAALVSRESRIWKDGVLASVAVEGGDGARVITEYENDGPAAGKPAKVTTERDGAIVSTETHAYDADGRLSAVERTGDGVSVVIEYAYDESGSASSVRTSRGGLTVSVVRYESATTRVEELYDDGVAFARVRYEDGRRVLEEILRDGVVVRSRSFE